MTFDKQSKCRRMAVELKSDRSCNHRVPNVDAVIGCAAYKSRWQKWRRDQCYFSYDFLVISYSYTFSIFLVIVLVLVKLDFVGNCRDVSNE